MKDIIEMNEKIGMVNYKMIWNFFEGKCSDEEKKTVLAWVNESKQNMEQFLKLEEIYFLGRHNISDEKCDRAKQKFQQRIENQEKGRKLKSIRLYSIMRYAAVFVGVLVLSIFAYLHFSNENNSMIRFATAEGETKQLVLPDGSKVWLNENTSLEYPENFEDDIRLLSLNGEAYFEVTSNKHKPFVVKGSTMQIEVLGTKFNFKSSDKCRIAEASLLEGEIKASGNANEGLITLSPGQKVELNTYTRQMKVSNTDAEIDAIWHNDFVQLKNANIYDIALMLERIYNVNIVLSPEINKGNTYSGVLQKKKNIDEVLDILSHTIHFNYVINKRNIFISVE